MQEKKKKKRILKIEVGKDDVIEEGKYMIPQALQVWGSPKEMSKEYLEMSEDLTILARVIAKKLNEGPEVNESVVKRSLTLKNVLKEILITTFMDGYHRYGVLEELLLDTYMELGGSMKTLHLLKAMGARAQMMAQKKRELYVS